MDRAVLPAMLVTGCLLLCSACSGSTTTPTLPSGWKTVAYHGVGIDVPARWAVEPGHSTCGVTSSTVFLGPGGFEGLGCAFVFAGAQVVLGANYALQPGRGVAKTTINGLNALMVTTKQSYQRPSSGTGVYIQVTLPSKRVTINVFAADSSVAPGGAPGRAMKIVETIHSVDA